MFRWVRCASVVRVALGVAVLASIAAGFGLHPEPADSGIAPAGAGIAAKAAIPPVSHGCLACLTCGAAIVRPLAAVILCRAGGPRPLRPFSSFPLVAVREAARNRVLPRHRA
jgi:hypothetical protein